MKLFYPQFESFRKSKLNNILIYYFCHMSNYENIFKKVVSHKEYGYVFQSSEIYDGLSAYDYGPFGVELKNNIKNYWWKSMVNI